MTCPDTPARCTNRDPLAPFFAEWAEYLHEQHKAVLPMPYTLCVGAGHLLYVGCKVARVEPWRTPGDTRRVVHAGVCV